MNCSFLNLRYKIFPCVLLTFPQVDSSHDSKVDLSAVKVIHKNDRVQFTDEGWYRYKFQIFSTPTLR